MRRILRGRPVELGPRADDEGVLSEPLQEPFERARAGLERGDAAVRSELRERNSGEWLRRVR